MYSDEEALEKFKGSALWMMKAAGFGIPGKLKVLVDPELPFMGYSTRQSGENIIVIAGKALQSGMVEGLLVHEMSHIYRINKLHPSHNSKLLDKVGYSIINQNHLTKDYQIKVIQQAVNHIQDLYADDIAFKVFRISKIFPNDQAFNFFLDWINDEPLNSKEAKAVWLNVGVMLNNCFALSNMIRHVVPDVNHQAENKVQAFLARTNEQMREAFAYFKDFMINLKENVTEKEFEEDLTNYLTKVSALAD
jgi:hypothetical protein